MYSRSKPMKLRDAFPRGGRGCRSHPAPLWIMKALSIMAVWFFTTSGLGLLAADARTLSDLHDELRRREAEAAELHFDYEIAKRNQRDLNDLVRENHPDVRRDPDIFQTLLNTSREEERRRRNAYFVGLEERKQRLEELRREVKARARGEPEASSAVAIAMAANVRQLYLDANLRRDMPSLETAAVALDATSVMRTAEAIATRLLASNPVTDAEKSRHVQDLVDLAFLAAGQKRPPCTATYAPSLKNEQGEACYGQWSPKEGIKISETCLQELGGSLHFQLLTASHEVVHALDYKSFEETSLKDVTSPKERWIRTMDWMQQLTQRLPYLRSENNFQGIPPERVRDLRQQLGIARNEIRTEHRAAAMVNAVMVHPDIRAVHATKEYRAVYKQDIRRVYVAVRELLNGGGDAGKNLRYGDKLTESRTRFGWVTGDRGGNYQKTMRGAPVFGGVVLGAPMDAGGWSCRGMEFIEHEDRWTLRLHLGGGNGTTHAEYDPGSNDDLWSAYNIIRPSAEMRQVYGLCGDESSLVTCEATGWGDLQAAMHPALQASAVGHHMMGLEAAAGAALQPARSEAPDDQPPPLVAVQWHDLPTRLEVVQGRIVVANPHDRHQSILAARIRAGDASMVMTNQQAFMAAAAATLAELGQGQPTEGEFDLLLSRHLGMSAAVMYTDVPISKAGTGSKLRAEKVDLDHVDRFGRTLALLAWVSQQLGNRLPDLPVDVIPGAGAVPSLQSSRESQGLLPTPQQEEDIRMGLRMLTPHRTGEVWYKIQENGGTRGVMWIHQSASTDKDGVWTKVRSWETVLFELRLGQVIPFLERGEAEVDGQGRLLRSSLSFGMGMQPRWRSFDSVMTGPSVLLKYEVNGRVRSENAHAQDWPHFVDRSMLLLGGVGFSLPRGQHSHFKAIFNRSDLRSVTPSNPYQDVQVSMVDPLERILSYRIGTHDVLIDWGDRDVPEKTIEPRRELSFIPCTKGDALRQEVIVLRPSGPGIAIQGSPRSLTRRFRVKIETKPQDESWILPSSEWATRNTSGRELELENATSLAPGYSSAPPEDRARRDIWLRPSSLVDSGHLLIKGLAQSSAMEAESQEPLALCRALEARVAGLIQNDYGQAVVPASKVLTTASGDCKHHSILLCALMRATGIPARVVCGLVIPVGGRSAIGHAWVQAMIDGKWHRFDSAIPGQGAVYIGIKEAGESLDDFFNASSKFTSIIRASIMDDGEMPSPFQWIGPRASQETVKDLAKLSFCIGYLRSRLLQLSRASDAKERNARDILDLMRMLQIAAQDLWESKIRSNLVGDLGRDLDPAAANYLFELHAHAFGHSSEARRASAVDPAVGGAFSVAALLDLAHMPMIQLNRRLRDMIVERFEFAMRNNSLPEGLADSIQRAFWKAIKGNQDEEGPEMVKVHDLTLAAISDMLDDDHEGPEAPAKADP